MLKVLVICVSLFSLTMCLKRSFMFGFDRKLDQDCDLINWCEGDLKCRDYRCKPQDTKDNQVPWAPQGIKCDQMHVCQEGKKCIKHRCESIIQSNSSIITPNATTQSNANETHSNTTNATIQSNANETYSNTTNATIQSNANANETLVDANVNETLVDDKENHVNANATMTHVNANETLADANTNMTHN